MLLFRSVLIALLFSSLVHAQLERFEKDDLPKWALIARVATDFEEFDLTSAQLDKLKESDIKNANSGFRIPGDREELLAKSAKEYLNTVYEVLDESQQKRLHEIMFQRWMNRDELAIALNAFAPKEVAELGTKVSSLNKRIEERRNETLDDLPSEQREQQEPLAEFLGWRWKQQTAWLEKELGAERAKQLVGKPVTLAYNFMIGGDPEASQMSDPFGDPYGGGVYFGSMGMSWGTSNGIEHITVGPVDPATGKIPQPKRRAERPKRPVDVPEGWTLDDAWENLKELQTREDDLANQFGEQLAFRPGGRMDFQSRRVLEAQARQESQLLTLEMEKAERIVEELGGDPQEEANQIREAQQVFRTHGIVCNKPPFVSHMKVTAEQLNALDEIADDFGSSIHNFNEEKKLDYHDAILDVLDGRQKRLMKQLLFRQYWFSENCELAFTLTKVKLTDEQSAKVAALAERLRETNEEIRSGQRNSMRRRVSAFHMSSRRNQNTAYRPMVALAKEFKETLNELVGAKNAASLIGKPMEYDRDWKRPVIVPAGLTFEQAKKEHEELAAKFKNMQDEGSNRFEELLELGALGNGVDIRAQMEQSQEEFQQVERKAEIAKRIYEELQASQQK